MSQVIVMSPEDLGQIIHTVVRNAVKDALEDIKGARLASASMTTKQAAEYLGVSVGTLNQWRCHLVGPKFKKYDRAVRYTKADLDEWRNSTSILTTDCSEIRNGKLH